MELTQYLKPQSIVLLPQGGTKEGILRTLVDRLDQGGYLVDSARALVEIHEREDVMSTGIGLGLAFPHIKSRSVATMGMALAVSQTPVMNYESLDGQPVYFVMMIAAPDGAHRLYLEALARSNQLLRSEKFRTSLREALDADQAYASFQVPS